MAWIIGSMTKDELEKARVIDDAVTILTEAQELALFGSLRDDREEPIAMFWIDCDALDLVEV